LGFMESIALKAEAKRTRQMIESLRLNAPDLDARAAEAVCAENNAWKHVSLILTPPSGEEYHFHRCRQIWFLGMSSTDLNPEELIRLDITNPATHEPFVSDLVQFRESMPLVKEHRKLWASFAELIGAPKSLVDSKSDVFIEQAMDEARPLGMLLNPGYGSQFLDGEKPQGQFGQTVHSRLTKLRDYLADYGVLDEDIRSYWDLTPLEQNLLIADVSAFRLLSFAYLMRDGVHESQDAAAAHAAILTDELVPKFEAATLLAQKPATPASGLPLEILPRVMEWYLDMFARGGFPEVRKQLGSRSGINELARDWLTEV